MCILVFEINKYNLALFLKYSNKKKFIIMSLVQMCHKNKYNKIKILKSQ